MCLPPPAGTLAAMNQKSKFVAGVAAGLVAAACSASPSAAGGSPSAGGSANTTSAVRYTSCMRSHGVPDYPGPDSSGYLPKITPSNEQQLGVSQSRFNAAQSACQAQWPYQAPTQAQQQDELAGDLKFARCMRAHGLPGFPDPTPEPNGPRFLISISKDGFNPHSARVLALARECQHVLPAGTGLPSVTVTS
jgi:hypothetical protein